LNVKRTLGLWMDSGTASNSDDAGIDWIRILPFIGLHVACLAIPWVGFSWVAVVVFLASFWIRMFAITAFYHRYFAHRTFKVGRITQFLFGVLGATATQRGPLWWAAHHRLHHKQADTEHDPHAPRHGFLWSHMGWFLSRKHLATETDQIPDLMVYPELRWLDRFDLIVPVIYAACMFALGACLARWAPGLGTDGWQMLVWGYFLSTVVLIHSTLLINSMAHVVGTRRYETRDDSRNNWLLALLTLGEGWHNNHHHYPGSARQGFYWWEIDISYYVLCMMARLGLVRDLKKVPANVRQARQVRDLASR